MSLSIHAVSISLFIVFLSMGGDPVAPQANAQESQAKAAKVGDADLLGVQEVGLQPWKTQPQKLPDPEEIKVGVPPQVILAPGPKQPIHSPEQEDHRGIQVKVLNPEL